MSDTIALDEPQRVAVQHEVFDDGEGDSVEVGQWVEQRDTVLATHVRYGDGVVAFENRESDDCLLVSTENFISAWTEGATE